MSGCSHIHVVVFILLGGFGWLGLVFRLFVSFVLFLLNCSFCWKQEKGPSRTVIQQYCSKALGLF